MIRSIRFRLYLVFGVLTTLILMLALFEAAGTREIARAVDRLSGVSIDRVQSLARIGKVAADVRVADGRAILGDTPALQAQAMQEARMQASRFQREVGRYADLAADGEEVQLYQALLTRADAFVAAQSDFERRFVEPGGSPVEWYGHAGRTVYDQVRDATEALISENDRQTSSDVAGARSRHRSMALLAAVILGATLLLALALVVYVAARIVEPLARLTAAMGRLAQGDWATEVPATGRKDEVGEMARAILAFRRQGISGEEAAERLRELNGHLERLAMIDPLTGVANRRHFYQRAEIEIEAAHRRHAPLACLMLDIDFFKSINDGHGHAAGDLVLKRTADIIAAGVRPYDLLGRLGGEEFAVILPDTDRPTAAMIAERLRLAVSASPALVDGVQLPVTVSIGVSELTAEDLAVDPLLDRADRALYEAKDAGRDRVAGPYQPKSVALAAGP